MKRQNLSFTPGTVVCELDSTKKYDAIHELIGKAPVFQDFSDPVAFETSVIQREKAQSTGYGKGVAFAHGRADERDGFIIALGISKRGIEWDSIDGQPVHLLFIIASNPSRKLEYLIALSALAELVRNDSFRSRLIQGGCIGRAEKLLFDAFNDSFAMKTA